MEKITFNISISQNMLLQITDENIIKKYVYGRIDDFIRKENLNFRPEDGTLEIIQDPGTFEQYYRWSIVTEKPKQSSKIFIISGNKQEFDNYVKKEFEKDDVEKWALKSNYVFVSGPEVLRGYRNPKGKFIGSYRQRSDLHDIIMNIAAAHDKPKTKLDELYSSVLR